MAYIKIKGKRAYIDTTTGKEISRRQYDKITKGIQSYEKKAAANLAADKKAALARPARGRGKARTEAEAERRVEDYERLQLAKAETRLMRKAKQRSKPKKVYKIRPQLLKAGHRAARIPFWTYDQYESLIEQAKTVKAPDGKRLIVAYGLGVSGFDERTGNEINMTVATLQSPSVVYDEDEMEGMLADIQESKPYFIFTNWWMHLHFNYAYATAKYEKSRNKSIPPSWST